MNPAQRQAYLDAMGIRAWTLRDRSAATAEPGVDVDTAAEPDEAIVAQAAPIKSKAGGFPADMLRAALRGEAPTPEPVVEKTPASKPDQPVIPAQHARPEVSDLDWTGLATQVAGCRACALHGTRTQAVFGSGNPTANLLIISEGPNPEEDREGQPFVGQSGQLLDAMLQAIGLSRQVVYLTNLVKCRASGNRAPEPEEVERCQPYLARQIALQQPQLILCVGAVSAQQVLATDLPVGKLRGRFHEHASGVPVAVTYHPSYLLRRPEEKAKVWQDLQQLTKALSG